MVEALQYVISHSPKKLEAKVHQREKSQAVKIRNRLNTLEDEIKEDPIDTSLFKGEKRGRRKEKTLKSKRFFSEERYHYT